MGRAAAGGPREGVALDGRATLLGITRTVVVGLFVVAVMNIWFVVQVCSLTAGAEQSSASRRFSLGTCSSPYCALRGASSKTRARVQLGLTTFTRCASTKLMRTTRAKSVATQAVHNRSLSQCSLSSASSACASPQPA
jgi:hypothetical protein